MAYIVPVSFFITLCTLPNEPFKKNIYKLDTFATNPKSTKSILLILLLEGDVGYCVFSVESVSSKTFKGIEIEVFPTTYESHKFPIEKKKIKKNLFLKILQRKFI